MTGLCFLQIWYSSIHPINSSNKIIPRKNLENSLNHHELSRGLSRAILLTFGMWTRCGSAEAAFPHARVTAYSSAVDLGGG